MDFGLGFLNFCPVAAEAVSNPERWAYYTGAMSPICDFSLLVPLLAGVVLMFYLTVVRNGKENGKGTVKTRKRGEKRMKVDLQYADYDSKIVLTFPSGRTYEIWMQPMRYSDLAAIIKTEAKVV